MAKIITITNLSRRPLSFAVAPDPKSTLFTPSGMVTLLAGKTIRVELKRISEPLMTRFKELGLIRFSISKQETAPPAPEVPEALMLTFTYAIGGPVTEMDPDEIISGLAPVEFTSGTIVVTNNGTSSVDVEAASLDPASNATISGFTPSTIGNGGTNTFNLDWGGANPFDEDLTITVNGQDFVFTFQGSIQGGST